MKCVQCNAIPSEGVVGLGQNVAEVFVLRLDGLHGRVDGLADIGTLGRLSRWANRAVSGMKRTPWA